MLSAVDEAENEILHKRDIPKGQLKISVPAYFGQLYVAPLLSDFLTLYPEVDISINFSDQFIDIIQDGYDLAVRIDNLQDSCLISKKIGVDQRLVAPKFDIQAVYPRRDFLPHRVRLFIELLKESLASQVQWNR
ncbi:MAG: hypothetical protein KAH22_11475 [Thiotrichaceae bacterium]|nr:hypothetical protein [Thiotrichaceae bacterium]